MDDSTTNCFVFYIVCQKMPLRYCCCWWWWWLCGIVIIYICWLKLVFCLYFLNKLILPSKRSTKWSFGWQHSIILIHCSCRSFILIGDCGHVGDGRGILSLDLSNTLYMLFILLLSVFSMLAYRPSNISITSLYVKVISNNGIWPIGIHLFQMNFSFSLVSITLVSVICLDGFWFPITSINAYTQL